MPSNLLLFSFELCQPLLPNHVAHPPEPNILLFSFELCEARKEADNLERLRKLLLFSFEFWKKYVRLVREGLGYWVLEPLLFSFEFW